jgi:hypothetical protein
MSNTTEIEKMMARLLAMQEERMTIMKACLEKMEDNQEKIETKTESYSERMEALMDTSLETTETWLEDIRANQEEVEAKMEACAVSVEASHEKLKATVLEANPEEIEVVKERQEVPNEETTAETIGALEDLYGDRCLAVRPRGQPKKRTQGDGGPRQKLTATRARLGCRVIPALHKGHSPRGSGKTPGNGRQELRLGSKRNVNEALRQTLHSAGDHKLKSRVFREDSKDECQYMWGEPATAQAKEETAHSLRARDVGAPVILGSFARTDRKRRNGGNPVGYTERAAVGRE